MYRTVCRKALSLGEDGGELCRSRVLGRKQRGVETCRKKMPHFRHSFLIMIGRSRLLNNGMYYSVLECLKNSSQKCFLPALIDNIFGTETYTHFPTTKLCIYRVFNSTKSVKKCVREMYNIN